MSRSQPPSPKGGLSQSLCKKACDSCRKRKIKCEIGRTDDGAVAPPCKPCVTSRIKCLFESPVLQKGPKPGASRLRHNEARQPDRHKLIKDTAGNLVRECRQDDLVTSDLVNFYLRYYFGHIHSGLPILTEAHAGVLARAFIDNDEAYILLCAFMSFLTLTADFTLDGSIALNATQNSGNLGVLFLEEAERIRRNIDLPRGDALTSVLTSFLLSKTYTLHNEDERAYYRSGEAVSSFNLLLARADPSQDLDPSVKLVFWALFVDHKTWSMRRDFPFTLSTTSNPHPSLAQLPDGHNISGFVNQIALVRSFEPAVLNQWRSVDEYRLTPEFDDLRAQLEEALRHHLTQNTAYLMPFEDSFQWASAMLFQLFEGRQMPEARAMEPLVLPTPTLQQFVHVLQQIVEYYNPRHPSAATHSLRHFLHSAAYSFSYVNTDVPQGMFSSATASSAALSQPLLSPTMQPSHSVAPGLSSPTYMGPSQFSPVGQSYVPVTPMVSRIPSTAITQGLYYSEPSQQQAFLYPAFSQADVPSAFYGRDDQYTQGTKPRRHL